MTTIKKISTYLLGQGQIFVKIESSDPGLIGWGSAAFAGHHKLIAISVDKYLTDFYLLTQCKYHIVGPSTFSWWGAWLSNFNSKICIRPSKINPSNNLDFWPESWISI